MKKLLFLLALPMLALVSCDDDNTPNVNVGICYANATTSDGIVYLVKGDTLAVDSLWVTAVNTDHKASIVGPVTYAFGGMPVARVLISPFKVRLATDDAAVGSYSLQALMDVAEEGCSLAAGASTYEVKIVADSADIPADASVGLPVIIRD